MRQPRVSSTVSGVTQPVYVSFRSRTSPPIRHAAPLVSAEDVAHKSELSFFGVSPETTSVAATVSYEPVSRCRFLQIFVLRSILLFGEVQDHLLHDDKAYYDRSVGLSDKSLL